VDGWQTEQGLPLNTVQSLLQTQDGYLWVGTAGGLARFDGARFTDVQADQAPGPKSQPVFGLMEDAQHNLWIGHSKGAYIYRNGEFEPAFSSDLTASRRVWAFAQGADGVVWSATENGLVRWENGATRLFQEADGLPTKRLRSLAFDRDGVLWIGTTGGGLVSYSAGRFDVLNPANGFPHLQVRFVLADPGGGVWAATAGGGLAHVNQGKIKNYTTKDGLPTNQLTSLALDAEGALWIGTWGAGVSRMREGRFDSLNTAAGLAGNQIWTLQVDREGSIWLGTWVGGLNRLRNRNFMVLGAPEGLTHDNTRAVLHGSDGVTWVSTAGGGINRIEGNQITSLGQKDGLPSDEVSTLLEDNEGSIWIGTYTGGIARLRHGRLETFGLAQGLPNLEIRSLYQDRKGTLWAGTQSELVRFTGQGFSAVRAAGLPAGSGVVTILEDRSGTLWFGTAGQGLVRYRNEKFTTLTTADGLVSNWVMALYEDAQATIWIGTNGEGMNRLRDDRLVGIRTRDGLWDGMSLSVLEDRSGFLWMTCNRGFYRVARAELNAFADGQIAKVQSTGFGPGDALRGTTFAGGHQAASGMDKDGHLWFPSANGMVIVDPLHLPGEGTPPAVRLENVLVDGISRSPDVGVILPAGSVPLSIRFTAMTLNNADRVKFRYQMDGITHDWVDAGRNREASFPALPHGSYRFRVAASIDGKNWSKSEGVINVVVEPYFYQTAWFFTLAVLGAIAAVRTLYKLRTRSLRDRQAQMEHLIAQRTEELRLANEHLSRLSFMDALTGLANRRRFDEALEHEWRRALRAQTSLAIIMADVDQFKRYNDVLGHPQGDKCLTTVAQVLAHAAGRAGDLVARYGGEEFIVLLPGADQAAAMHMAEELRAACEALAIPHPASPQGDVVTLSLGVASCVPLDEAAALTLVTQADAALYLAKQQGRNRVCQMPMDKGTV
jgi:diguanylate cyclase (GGDEF)-like protein